jgi:hypothetical protein
VAYGYDLDNLPGSTGRLLFLPVGIDTVKRKVRPVIASTRRRGKSFATLFE